MIEIRKHPDVTAALYVSDLSMKLPEDHSWIVISDRFSIDELERSQNLAEAFESGLIEIQVRGDYTDIPSWYLEMYKAVVRVPTELLDDDGSSVVQSLQNLKEDAHPIMWSIICLGLLESESQGQGRSNILNMLVP